MIPVSGEQLAKLVESKGWALLRTGISRSHHICAKAGSNVRLSIPIHGASKLKLGLQRHLMKLAGPPVDNEWARPTRQQRWQRTELLRRARRAINKLKNSHLEPVLRLQYFPLENQDNSGITASGRIWASSFATDEGTPGSDGIR